MALGKQVTPVKKPFFLKKKVGDAQKNGSNLMKWATLGKMGHIQKNASHLENWVTLKKMGQTM